MKNQKRKAVALGMAAAMTAALLSGCGTKATPENLLRDMADNAEGTESVLMNLKVGMDMDGMEMSIDMDMESTVNPEAAYGKGVMGAGLGSFSYNSEMEMYTLMEDDEYVTYMGIDDVWTKEVTDEDAAADVSAMSGDMEDYAEYFELSEELVTVNGKDCFELTGNLGGEVISDMMQADMIDSLSGYSGDESDFEDMEFECTIDIYKDTILPARVYIDMTDTLAALLEEEGIEMGECYVDMTLMEYNKVEPITVPDEVIAAAEDTDSYFDDWLSDDDSDYDDDLSWLYEDTDDGVTPAEPAEQSDELGASWDSYTVQINDTVVTLPCSIADLEAAGLTMDREYTPDDYVVNAGEYELAWFEDANGNEITADIINTSDEAKQVKDCLVGGISLYSYDLDEGGLTVLFPGGIQIGSSIDDAIAAYGEPTDTYESAEYGGTYYWYSDDSYYNCCTLDTDADTGLIDSIDLEHHE